MHALSGGLSAALANDKGKLEITRNQGVFELPGQDKVILRGGVDEALLPAWLVFV
jgi:hypothetical protein